MIGINLIDDSVLASRLRRRCLRRWMVVLLATMGLAIFPVGLEASRRQSMQSLNLEKSMLSSQMESSQAKLSTVALEIRALQAQAARADALRRKRPWSQLLGKVAEVMPEELWLISLATVPSAPAGGNRNLVPAAAAKNPSTGDGDDEPQVVTMEAPRALAIEGYALAHKNLYEFMSRLKGTGLFVDISLTRASEEPVMTEKAIRFKIECSW